MVNLNTKHDSCYNSAIFLACLSNSARSSEYISPLLPLHFSYTLFTSESELIKLTTKPNPINQWQLNCIQNAQHINTKILHCVSCTSRFKSGHCRSIFISRPCQNTLASRCVNDQFSQTSTVTSLFPWLLLWGRSSFPSMLCCLHGVLQRFGRSFLAAD